MFTKKNSKKLHTNLNKCQVENCPALPGRNLISTCNRRVRSVPAGQGEISSQQTRSCNHHLRYLNECWIHLCIYWEVNVLSYRVRWERNCASILNAITECVPMAVSFDLNFLCISKVWSMSHHGSMGHFQSKEGYFIFTYTFVAFFCCFLSKMCVSIIYFSDEVSNFRHRVLTNQKPELVIRNSQWNCMRNIEI